MATHRLTRLLTYDKLPIIAVPRERAQAWLRERDRPGLAYLLSCAWCASIWLGGLLVLGLALYVAVGLHQSWWPWPLWLGVWLTASSVTGLIASREP